MAYKGLRYLIKKMKETSRYLNEEEDRRLEELVDSGITPEKPKNRGRYICGFFVRREFGRYNGGFFPRLVFEEEETEQDRFKPAREDSESPSEESPSERRNRIGEEMDRVCKEFELNYGSNGEELNNEVDPYQRVVFNDYKLIKLIINESKLISLDMKTNKICENKNFKKKV